MKKNLYALLLILTALSAVWLGTAPEKSVGPLETQSLDSGYSTTGNGSLQFEAELVNKTLTEDSPAVIRFEIDSSMDNFTTYSGPYAPFSTPEAEKQGSGYSIHLWSDGYRGSNYITPGEGFVTRQLSLRKTWNRSTIEREYELRTREPLFDSEKRIETGSYIINGSIGYSQSGAEEDRKQLDYTVTFEVE